jgi:hypothetical protein
MPLYGSDAMSDKEKDKKQQDHGKNKGGGKREGFSRDKPANESYGDIDRIRPPKPDKQGDKK